MGRKPARSCAGARDRAGKRGKTRLMPCSRTCGELYEKCLLRACRRHFCGESEIRTRDTLLGYTRFPGVPLQPLEHLSNTYPVPFGKNRTAKVVKKKKNPTSSRRICGIFRHKWEGTISCPCKSPSGSNRNRKSRHGLLRSTSRNGNSVRGSPLPGPWRARHRIPSFQPRDGRHPS